MVSDVVNAVDPLGVTLAGANIHVAPAGEPPVQAKVIVEWTPSSGIAVSTTGPASPAGATVHRAGLKALLAARIRNSDASRCGLGDPLSCPRSARPQALCADAMAPGDRVPK